MITQKTSTTEVDPMVSVFEGKVTFLSSPLTSDKNSTMRPQSLPILFDTPRTVNGHVQPHIHQEFARHAMAGAPGLEPGPSVLETDMLAIDTMPLRFQLPKITHPILLPYEEHAFGKIDNTSFSPNDPDHFFYFSSSNNFVVCIHHRLEK